MLLNVTIAVYCKNHKKYILDKYRFF